MAEAKRIMENMTHNTDVHGKLKDVSNVASDVVSKAQSNLKNMSSRSRDLFNRATGRMTTNSWIALGFGLATVGLTVFFRSRSRSGHSNVSDFIE